MKSLAQGPNYRKIFADIIEMKHPEKKHRCSNILEKKKLSVLDVVELNTIIFGYQPESQKFKSYDEKAIKEILNHQLKSKLSNTQLAEIYKLSRNTVTAWKRKYRY
ncbi:helix-turn-helix domain-containing protein [Chryseobacterium sp. G0162]|uniref:helix-turn-helix domain-containing protein n=1 Tax=Chryseobacterium sp. G0162 TaxID=2487063 RepID=UPI000F4F9BAC|nr:helix-turn-helix domain-containing protein [Chryseobacterium sp. G0162]AZB07655.1 helix-turn-helix domain-containing protein [Chryseobacterium sp. G0162]